MTGLRLMRWMAAAVVCMPSAVSAGTDSNKTGVLILASSPDLDRLSDNLTEVLLADLAAIGHDDLVGTGELHDHLAVQGTAVPAFTCPEQPECISSLITRLRLRSILTGMLRRTPMGYGLDLRFTDSVSARPGMSDLTSTYAASSAEGDQQDLLSAARQFVHSLLDRRGQRAIIESPAGISDPSTKTSRPEILMPSAPAVADSRWPTYAVEGFIGAGTLSLIGGAIFGVLARQDPTGRNREEAQMDLNRRDTYATTANVLFVGGGALLTTGIVLLSTNWRRIVGR